MDNNNMAFKNENLKILEVEREHAQTRLVNQISSIRNMLDNLESKLNNNQELYISDGLQGDGANIDKYLAQLVTYSRAIGIFYREFSENDRKSI